MLNQEELRAIYGSVNLRAAAKLQEEGTSEGAKKGWEGRGGGNMGCMLGKVSSHYNVIAQHHQKDSSNNPVMKLSRNALRLTDNTMNAGSNATAKQHDAAASAHEKLSQYAFSGAGVYGKDKVREAHEALADFHTEKANAIRPGTWYRGGKKYVNGKLAGKA